MSRPRAADYAEQRARILERAVSAFARLGYPSATMADLAEACGTSKAALYHYFPSKEALLFEALDAYTARLSEIVDAVASRGLAPRDELRALVREFLAAYHRSRDHHVSLLHDVKFLAPAQRDRIRAPQRRIVEHFASLLSRAFPGAVDARNRKPMTMALLGMINFTFAWWRPDGPIGHDAYADLVIDLWFDGARGAGTDLQAPPEGALSRGR